MKKQTEYLYESVTEYDINYPKRYDMKLDGANTVILSGYDGEKIRVRLASDTLTGIQSDFKLKIDDIKNRIDVSISRRNEMTQACAKEVLMIFVHCPISISGRLKWLSMQKQLKCGL